MKDGNKQVAKTPNSRWQEFAWQAGYGAFSVSTSLVEDVKKYIQNQQQHHPRMSFQDEFRELCRRHGLELDEQYAWD